MTSWLIDEPALTYMLLAIAALAFVVGWWRTRNGKLALGVIFVMALIVGVWLLGLFVPTNTKKISHALREMSQGVKTQDINRIFAHISDQFQQGPPTFGSNLDKTIFRQRTAGILQSHNVDEVEVWDIHLDELAPEGRTAKVSFSAKPKGNWSSGVFYLVRAQFVLDADGQWRLQGFEVFNPAVNTKDPLQIPGT